MITFVIIIAFVLVAATGIFAFYFYNKLSILRVLYDNHVKECEFELKTKQMYLDALNVDYKTLEEQQELQLLELKELFESKVKEFQGVIDEYEIYLKYYEKYFDSITEIIKISDGRIKQIDAKGSFKSDDEVGFFFQNVQEIQAALNEFNLTRPAFKAESSKSVKIVDGIEIPKGANYISGEEANKIFKK